MTASASRHLNHVATVPAEPAETINPEKPLQTAGLTASRLRLNVPNTCLNWLVVRRWQPGWSSGCTGMRPDRSCCAPTWSATRSPAITVGASSSKIRHQGSLCRSGGLRSPPPLSAGSATGFIPEPGIVTLHDPDKTGGKQRLVTEFANACSLTHAGCERSRAPRDRPSLCCTVWRTRRLWSSGTSGRHSVGERIQ